MTDKAEYETCKQLLNQNPPCSDTSINVVGFQQTGGSNDFITYMENYHGCANTNVKQCIKKSCGCPYDYLCDNVTCDNYCSGDVLYKGSCNKGSCTYTSVNCTYGCDGNDCITDDAVITGTSPKIENASYYPDKNYVSVVVRNIGRAKIYLNEINIYIDNYPQQNYTSSKPSINPGDAAEINITNVTTSCSGSTLTLVLKWGIEASRVIQCP